MNKIKRAEIFILRPVSLFFLISLAFLSYSKTTGKHTNFSRRCRSKLILGLDNNDMKRLNKFFIFGVILILLINLFPLTSFAGKSCNHNVVTTGGHAHCSKCGTLIHFSSSGNRCSQSGCNKKTKLIVLPGHSATSFNNLTNEDELAVGCTGDAAINTKVEERVFKYYQGTDANYKGPTEYPNAKQEYFKCRLSASDNEADFKEIMVPYYTIESFYYETYPGPFRINPTFVSEEALTLKHTTIFVNTEKFPLALEDVHIDIDGGRLVISGTINDDVDAWNQIYSSIQGIIVGVTGLGTLCCLFAMIMQIMKLGAAAGNPMDREKAIKGVLWTGIGTAGCGAAAFIFGLAYNIL